MLDLIRILVTLCLHQKFNSNPYLSRFIYQPLNGLSRFAGYTLLCFLILILPFKVIAAPVKFTLLDGTIAANPPLVLTEVNVLKMNLGGQMSWYDSVVSDSQGVVNLDLAGLTQGETYQLEVKSPTNQQQKYSELITSAGEFTFVVGNPPVILTLLDEQTNQPIADQVVTAYHMDADGNRHWYVDHQTDEHGQVIFDLDDLHIYNLYVLTATVYNGLSVSTPLIESAPADLTLAVGTVRVQLFDGAAENNQQPLVANEVSVYQLDQTGAEFFYAQVVTDEAGMLKLDLPQLENGTDYTLQLQSPYSEQKNYSGVISELGDHQYVIGNKPLQVTLNDGINHLPIANQVVDVYALDNNGVKQWFYGQATDANGKVSFDLPGLGLGTEYLLATTLESQTRFYSSVLSDTGSFVFTVANTQVQLLDGSVASLLPLVNHYLDVYQVIGGQPTWLLSALSDSEGLIQIDLDFSDPNASYQFVANSPVSGQPKTSGLITQAGEHTFTLGNPGVKVLLSNILTGAAYQQQQVAAYQVDAQGLHHWYYSQTTDQQGETIFDLDGIAQGQGYVFKVSVFTHEGFSSPVINSPSDVYLQIGAVPVSLINANTNEPMTNVEVTAYRILADGSLQWTRSDFTDEQGAITFDLENLSTEYRYVFKAVSPFGEGQAYFGPVISANGPVNFYLRQSEYGELDLQPPSISIASPGGSLANSEGFLVTGHAQDNTGIAKIELTVTHDDGQVQSLEASFEPLEGQWQAQVLSSWLSEGEMIIITATSFDFGLNQTQVSRSYEVRQDMTPPIVTVSSHVNGQQVNVRGFSLVGLISDDIEVASLSASLTDPLLGPTIVDQWLAIDAANGQWELIVTSGNMSPGQLVSIELQGTDLSGKVSQLSIALEATEVVIEPLQLVQRITFGLTPQLLARVNAGEDILTEQLSPNNIDDSEFEAQMATMAVNDKQQLKHYLLARMIGSGKQLQEVMTWFWENHFNTDVNTHGFVAYELAENQNFRELALGNFRDLLAVSAKSPAMIHYLNSQQNVAGKANENYAREIMELHTLGIGGGYTADDIAELSRVFTGWHENGGVFAFNDGLHDMGDKWFLGQYIQGSGVAEGEQVLDILATHPATASYICSKLITLFVSDQPLAELQKICAAEFLQSGGNILAIVTTILSSDELAAPEQYRSKVKTPLELVVSTARGFATAVGSDLLSQQLADMGMNLFEFAVPTGFSEMSEDWLNSNAVLQRIQLVNQAAWQQTNAFSIDIKQLLDTQGISSAEAVITWFFELALGNDFNALEYDMALAILDADSPFDINNEQADSKLKRLFGTVMSFPAYHYQ